MYEAQKPAHASDWPNNDASPAQTLNDPELLREELGPGYRSAWISAENQASGCQFHWKIKRFVLSDAF